MTIAQSPIDFAAPGLSTQPAALNADERATLRLGTYLTLPTQILLAFIVIFPLLMELYISLSSWTPLDGKNWLYAYRYWKPLRSTTGSLISQRPVSGNPSKPHAFHHGDLRAG